MAVQLTTTQMPIFAQNQVLRAEDLNNLVAYMDFQARLSRIFTIGIGPLNGLQPSVVCEQGQVISIGISPGFGISSDGYLFQVRQACVYGHIRVSFPGMEGHAYDCVKKAFNPKQEYLNCTDENEGAGIPCVLELSEDVEDGFTSFSNFDLGGDESVEPSGLPSAFINNYALALIRCEETVQRKRCFTDCEAAGADRSANIRAVLVHKGWISAPQAEGNQPEAVTISFGPAPVIRRFGYAEGGIRLCGIHTWRDFYLAYLRQCQNNESLISALEGAYQNYYVAKNGTDDAAPDFAALRNLVVQYASGESTYSDIQYLYSYLRDLVIAYREFEQVACGMTVLRVQQDAASEDTSQNAAFDLFQGHLVLGGLTCNGQNISDLRSPTILSDVKHAGDPRRNLAECLYNRLVSLSSRNNVRLPNRSGQGIHITPGLHQKNSLNGRAIPFYFERSGVQSFWDCRNTECQLPVHYYEQNSPSHPLLSEYCEYDFFRIEGHIGEELDSVLTRISEMRARYNIAFDIQQVRIGPGAELEMNREPAFGEIDELYRNTRADLLCKLDEVTIGMGFPGAAVIRQILNQAPFIRLLPLEPLPAGATESSCCDPVQERGLANDFVALLNAGANANQSLSLVLNTARGIFQDLVKKYHRMAQELERQRAFCGFAHQHPGMEHKGGAPKGGTLVLVYAYRFNSPQDRTVVENYFNGNNNHLTDEGLIAAAFALGGDFMFDLDKRTNKRVVADFCLPYFCCSNAPVVRNEIRSIRAAINIQGPFCQGERPSFTVSPEGGRMRFLVDGAERGAVIENVTGNQTLNIPGILNPAEDLAEGQAAITLEYTVGGTLVTESVLVYRRPDLALAVDRRFCYNEFCQFDGYEVLIAISNADNRPLTLESLASLQLILALRLEDMAIPATDELTEDSGRLVFRSCFGPSIGPDTSLNISLVAINGPSTCRQELQAQVDLACPQAVINWEVEGTGGVLFSVDHQANQIMIPGREWPDFMIFRPIPSGGRLLFGNMELAMLPETGPCENREYRLPLAAIGASNMESISGAMSYHLGNCGVAIYEVLISLSPFQDDPGDGNGGGTPIPLVSPGSGAVTPALSAGALQLLNQRQASYTLAFRNLEDADPTLANAAGFRLAKQFLLKQGDAVKLGQDFVSAAESLLRGMGMAAEERKPRYGDTLKMLVNAYMDKILASPAPLDEVVETTLAEVAAKMAAAGIGLAAIKRAWGAGKLKEVMDGARVGALQGMLRERGS